MGIFTRLAAYPRGVSTTAGLRERKKEATRQALHEAAVRLATEHGLDRLTVEAIAAAADVSRRTFSNYFAGKEDALLYGDEVRLRRLHELIAARPAGEHAWTALSRAAEQLTAEYETDPAWAAQRTLLRQHPALASRRAANYASSERAIAALITPRLATADVGQAPGEEAGAEIRARLLAAALETALRVTNAYWIDHPGDSLPAILRLVLTEAGSAWS